LDEYKINEKLQSKAKVAKSKRLREEGEQMMKKLAVSEKDIENIFDLIEEEIPEL
jgi:hypothetical protein